MKHTALVFILIIQLIALPQVGMANGALRCSEILDQYHTYALDYAPHLRAKFGGSEARWHQLIEKLMDRPREEVEFMFEIFRNTEARGWLSRQANSATHFQMEAIARTIDRAYGMQRIAQAGQLGHIRDWNQLSVTQRRALLLATFKKWWWEVDSHYVMGLSRWTDATYIMGRGLSEPIARGRIDQRIHELLGTSSQTSFLSGMISNFRAEVRILKNLKGQPNARETLQETLRSRLEFLQNSRSEYGLTGLRGNLLDIQILRTGVLLRMVGTNRTLNRAERNEVADSLGLPRSLIAEMRWGQFGMSVIPNLHMNARQFVEVMVQIALTTAIAYVLGQYMFEDLNNAAPYRGTFNDVFGTEPLNYD